MRSFQTKESVNKTNVSDGLFKPVTQQNLPQNRKQAEIHSNVLKLGMYRIATTITQNKEPQLPHASRNTNPHVSKSSGVNHTTSVSRPQLKCYQVKDKIVQLILFIVDSGCTKHMTGNLKLLCNFVEKFLGTVRFGNDQFAPIIGYGDLNQGNVTIKRVYYVEGLNHNLFSVGQFCDADLEVAFRKSTCFVRDLQGNDLLTGNRGSDLYTISLQETTSSTPICFMAKASPTQAWLWHRRLSHLNFDYITLLSKKDIVIGLPKLKYVKDQLCLSYEMSKEKRNSFKSKVVPSSKGRLNLLHMDLCGPMRVASINGKKYILVIVDDYSRYTWTLFLQSKDETPEVLKDFLTMIQRNLQAQVITVRTDRGTEFLNKTLHAYFKEEGIEHQTSTPRTPEQNGVVERRNRTLVEAARTMLSASKLPLSFWAEAARSSRTKGVQIDNSDPVPPRQNVVPSAEKTDSSHQGLEFLFSSLIEEYYTPTHGQAEENNNGQAPNASFQEDEFINPFCTRDELHQFDRLKVWELVDKPFGKMIIKLKWLWKNKKDEDQMKISRTNHLLQVDRLEAVRICVAPRAHKSFQLSVGRDKRYFINGPTEGRGLPLLSREGFVDPDSIEKQVLPS
ncbi:retrovirus-related pol polyprotein from transposon TNT 1-94 [Tanacetum coccineum]